MSDFVMPKLGADMTEGKLVLWRKTVGDAVHRGDILAEVDTDKGVIEIESFVEGTLESLVAKPGDFVPVGSVLAHIADGKGAMPVVVAAGPLPAPAGSPAGLAASEPTAAPPSPEAELAAAAPKFVSPEKERIRISPAARMLAGQLGVDLQRVHGTGPGGAITREDIEQAAKPVAAAAPAEGPRPPALAPQAPPQPSAEAPDRNARMRAAIAAAMARSNREIPHYYLSTTIDLKKALDWLERENEHRPVTDRLLYGVLLLKAAALALREVPELNAFWQDDHLQLQSSIHLGVAIALRGGGLIAPAIHDADHKSLGQLMSDLRDLVQRTRAGKLRSSELSDQTITVTSLGEQGTEAVFGVIYPPQVALVGFGNVVERPWCIEGQVVARPLATATLAGDHRATDGHRGAVFLTAVDRLLQEPEKL